MADQVVVGVQPGRGGQHQRVGGRAQLVVDPVQLVAGGAVHHQPELADLLVVADALEDEGGPGVEAVGQAPVAGGVQIPALAGEPDPDDGVRGPAQVAPDAAGLSGGGQLLLAGMRVPGPAPGQPPADLDDPRLDRVPGRGPVEAVAAQVHQPPAARGVGLQGVQHRARPVLGVAAGDDRLVARQPVGAAEVQVLVGEHVVGEALLLEPVDHVQVEGVAPRASRHPVPVGGPHRDDGPSGGRVGDPAAVGVQVVDGAAVLAVLAQELVQRVQGDGDVGEPAEVGAPAAGQQPLVGVGQVGGGRGQEGDVGVALPRRRGDEERHVVVLSGPAETGGVVAGAPPVADLDLEIGLPPAVVEVVVVEVDGAVLLGGVVAPEGGGVPPVAGEAPHRMVAERAVEAAGAHVGDGGAAGRGGGEVPGRGQPRHRPRVGPVGQGVDLAVAQSPGEHPRVLDLAVEASDRRRLAGV